MEKIRVMYDEIGNTLDVWLKKPQKSVSEETGKEIILKKDKKGNLIGFEVLNYLAVGKKIKNIPIEFIVSKR